MCPQIVCLNDCITIFPFVNLSPAVGASDVYSVFFTDAKPYGMVAHVKFFCNSGFQNGLKVMMTMMMMIIVMLSAYLQYK